jgi:LytR cell envelope-related transcriptional attenuator
MLGAAFALAACSSGDDGSTASGRRDATTTTRHARPPQEVRVFVINGAGIDQLAATEANKLRGLGYAIAGVGNAALQQGTVVACRKGFVQESADLALAVGKEASVVAFPEPEPAGVEEADCIVGLGSAAAAA